MTVRQDTIDNLHEALSLIETEDLEKASESLTLLSGMLPPWSPKAALEGAHLRIIEWSLETPLESEEPTDLRSTLEKINRRYKQKQLLRLLGE